MPEGYEATREDSRRGGAFRVGVRSSCPDRAWRSCRRRLRPSVDGDHGDGRRDDGDLDGPDLDGPDLGCADLDCADLDWADLDRAARPWPRHVAPVRE
ncbi:MAG TPA: hypothetical protein VFA83_04610 [Acidimicrobiales bacterium]|nr:hypothetical protein [Acidimicrobiales bacterium]